MYVIKAQSYKNPGMYTAYECADFASFVTAIVDVSQSRKKGAKYRLMSCDMADDGGVQVRFDVQYTKPSE